MPAYYTWGVLQPLLKLVQVGPNRSLELRGIARLPLARGIALMSCSSTCPGCARDCKAASNTARDARA